MPSNICGFGRFILTFIVTLLDLRRELYNYPVPDFCKSFLKYVIIRELLASTKLAEFWNHRPDL